MHDNFISHNFSVVARELCGGGEVRVKNIEGPKRHLPGGQKSAERSVFWSFSSILREFEKRKDFP